MLDDLIAMITDQLGVETGQARRGAGVLFALFERFGDNEVVRELLARIPGAVTLAADERATVESGGGGLMGAIGDLMGGNADAVTDALGAIQSTGFSLDQARDLISTVTRFARENLDADLIERVTESIPWLRDFT